MGSVKRGWTYDSNAYGRIDHVSGNGANSVYVGTCTTPDGREQTRRMRGDRDSVRERWLGWQEKTIEDYEARIEKEGVMATKEKDAATADAAVQGKVYVLRFASGRNSKNVLAFESQDKALAMACALEPALDIAGADGEYTVDEVPLQ